jgi:hypothetical protein
MLKPWYQVAVPHKDIRAGRVDESLFAASLSDVVAGRGPLEYQDPVAFFHQTYPTRGLVNLLTAVLGRLAGTGPGEPVIQVQTPFGGGKTHGLVALYHLFRSPESLSGSEALHKALQGSRAPAVPQTRVVTFDGVVADPLGRTPWGSLAAQLGRYEKLQEHDARRLTPGKDLLMELLAGAPTLILMDEIVVYAIKARDFKAQVLAFFQELTEAVRGAERCALVVTLPSSAPYGEEGERVLDQLQRIFGRLEAVYTPVEGTEVYEVIRRRLLEQVGDPMEAKRVAEAYWQMYQRLGEDIPAEARDLAYRERMQRAYPFHPQVIDTLYERWSTFPNFQRTRGVLRLLANVVADLYTRQHPAPLIQAAHLNLAHPDLRREFIRHIGNEYEGVIAADIVDTNAKAQRLDREMGSEYARFGVASGLATAIFFGSFSGGERRGVTVPYLRLALLQEDIPPAIVGDALQRLENELWFLHVEKGLYQFRNRPNLNRVILEREEAVREEDISEEVRTRLQRMAGNEMRVTLYPQASGDIPDSRELKLAILSGDHPGREPATTQFARELLDRAGTGYRAYRNTLLILAPDAGEFKALQKQVRRLLALRNIQGDRSLLETLSHDDMQTVRGKLRDAEGTLDFQLLSAYRHLARACAETARWMDLGLPTTGEQGSLARRVREYLKSQDLLLERLAPRHVVEKAFGPEEQEKPLGEVFDAFLRYPHLPLLESEEVLRRAVIQGVAEGVLGVRSGEQLLCGETVEQYLVQTGTLLVRPEVAQREKVKPIELPPPEAKETQAPPSQVPVNTVPRVHLRARVPWDQMSAFLRGVLTPLYYEGATLEIEICVDAHAPRGIKKHTLEQTVRETLRQIGAEELEYAEG